MGGRQRALDALPHLVQGTIAQEVARLGGVHHCTTRALGRSSGAGRASERASAGLTHQVPDRLRCTACSSAHAWSLARPAAERPSRTCSWYLADSTAGT